MKITASGIVKLGVVLLMVVAIVLVLWPSKSQTQQKSNDPPPSTATPNSKPHHDSSPSTGPSKANTSVPSQKGFVASAPDQIVSQLLPFLRANYRLKPHDTLVTRHSRIKPLVTTALLKRLELTIAGIPKGSTMVPQVDPSQLQIEIPKGTHQYYVIAPVVVLMNPHDGYVYQLLYKTSSVWVQKSGEWTMIDFVDDGGELITKSSVGSS